MSQRRPAELQRQEPAGPHRELRCPPGTYFSPRSLRSNPSDLEENAVLDHKVRPRHQAQPPRTSPPAEDPHPSYGPSNRLGTPRTHHQARGLHPQEQPSAVQRILEVQPARATSRTPTRPLGPPPPHMSGPSLSGPPRTPPAKYRPRLTRRPLPAPSQEPPSQQPRNLENLRLSGGTSGRHWAASTGSLRAYRRPSGQSLWDSWTPRPTCGVCVTTTLPRCPNGARDR